MQKTFTSSNGRFSELLKFVSLPQKPKSRLYIVWIISVQQQVTSPSMKSRTSKNQQPSFFVIRLSRNITLSNYNKCCQLPFVSFTRLQSFWEYNIKALYCVLTITHATISIYWQMVWIWLLSYQNELRFNGQIICW